MTSISSYPANFSDAIMTPFCHLWSAFFRSSFISSLDIDESSYLLPFKSVCDKTRQEKTKKQTKAFSRESHVTTRPCQLQIFFYAIRWAWVNVVDCFSYRGQKQNKNPQHSRWRKSIPPTDNSQFVFVFFLTDRLAMLRGCCVVVTESDVN